LTRAGSAAIYPGLICPEAVTFPSGPASTWIPRRARERAFPLVLISELD
jgi:hypothetical protein